MKSIFDASFRYSPSYGTDLRKTFDRIRREQQAQSRRRAAANSSGDVKVVQLEPAKKAGAQDFKLPDQAPIIYRRG